MISAPTHGAQVRPCPMCAPLWLPAITLLASCLLKRPLQKAGISKDSMQQTVLISDTPTDSRAGDVLLLPIAGLAFWTLAYRLVLVLRWPAKNAHVVFSGYRYCWFLLVRAAMEENQRNAWPGISVSSFPSPSPGSGLTLRNSSPLCATAEP